MSSVLTIENIKSLFIIFLIVSGNYLGDLIGCKMKYLLTENIYVKHLLLFLLIFITIGLVNEEKDRHPMDIMKDMIFLYILYIIVTRTNIYFTIILLVSIFILYIIDEIEKYEIKKSDTEDNKEKFIKMKDYVTKIIIFIIIFGFIYYLYDKRKEYKKNFNLFTFLLGKTNCKNN